MGIQSDKVKELWGRNFKIVKNGLDEAEVFSFVGNLIDQNNEYALKLENLDTLLRFADNTVIEAKKQAESSKIEIEEQANKRAAAVISEAEEKAKTETEIIITEAQEKANAEAERVLVEAQEQVKEINEKAERALAEAANRAEEQEKAKAEADKLLAEIEKRVKKIDEEEEKARTEAVKRAEEQVTRIISDSKQKAQESAEAITAAAEEQGQKIISAAEEQVKEINEKAEREALTAKQEAEELLLKSKKIAEREIKEKFQSVHQEMLSTLGLEDIDETTATPMEEATTPEPSEPVATAIAEAESQTDELQEQQPAIEHEEAEAESELEATAYAQEEASTAESEGIQPAIEQEEAEAESEIEATAYAQEEASTAESEGIQPAIEQEEAEAESELEATAHAQEEASTAESEGIQPAIEQEEAKQESPPLYEGTVELKIPPPIPFDRMLQLHKNLKRIPEIGVTNVQRLGDKGLTMELRLQSPIPLLKIIGNLPEVEKVLDDALSGAEGTALARRAKAKPRPGSTIIVTIKG